MFGIPKRWEMVCLLNSGILIAYCLRVSISVAAQDMREELDWSETQKGLVLSAFYWGYALGQIPSSRFAALYGAKKLFGLSVVIPSIITLFVPAACRSSFGLALFSRAFLGLIESASFPCVFHFLPSWVPLNEKPLMVSCIISGMYIVSQSCVSCICL
jgi:MFS transporter, ACS family, solute carrier family 17 (sodium-dependent inorganic phosphate cotransporter), other